MEVEDKEDQPESPARSMSLSSGSNSASSASSAPLSTPRPTKAQRTGAGTKRPLFTTPLPQHQKVLDSWLLLLLIVCALQGDVQLGDQIGLIATHLLHIGQQLEGLVKIGNILAGAARVRAFACVVVCVLCLLHGCGVWH